MLEFRAHCSFGYNYKLLFSFRVILCIYSIRGLRGEPLMLHVDFKKYQGAVPKKTHIEMFVSIKCS